MTSEPPQRVPSPRAGPAGVPVDYNAALVAHLETSPLESEASTSTHMPAPTSAQIPRLPAGSPAPWEVPDYDDTPLPPCPPTPPFVGSPLVPGWHLAPDPEPSKADLTAAVAAIARGPVPISKSFATFVVPNKDAPANEADWNDAVRAVGMALALPISTESTAPISGWSPSPVPVAPSVGPSPPVVPVPDDGHVPPETEEDVALARDLQVLQSAYPRVRPDILLTVLERKGSAAAALGWLSTIKEIESLTIAMSEVFPMAPLKEVSHLVQTLGGEMSSVWGILSNNYDSPWTAAFSSSAVQRKVSRSAMLVVNNDDALSDVLIASDPLKAFDAIWWLEYVTSRRYRLGTRKDIFPLWDSICSAAAIQGPIPPRFVSLVSSLGRRSEDRASFMEAVKVIRALPRFHDLSRLLSKTREASEIICRILIADGLISPIAALWLSLNSLTLCDDLLRKFAKAHISTCKSRNKAVRAQLSIPEASTTVKPLFIGSSDEGATDIDVDVEMAPVSTSKRPSRSRAGGSKSSAAKPALSVKKRPKRLSKSESANSATHARGRSLPPHTPAKSKLKTRAGLALNPDDSPAGKSFRDPPV